MDTIYAGVIIGGLKDLPVIVAAIVFGVIAWCKYNLMTLMLTTFIPIYYRKMSTTDLLMTIHSLIMNISPVPWEINTLEGE